MKFRRLLAVLLVWSLGLGLVQAGMQPVRTLRVVPAYADGEGSCPATAQSASTQPYVWQDFGYTYAYDSKSYLLSLTDSLGRSWWDSPVYDHLDRVTSVRKGSGHTTTRAYRPTDGVLTALNTGGGAIQNLGFTFDGLGNLTARTGPGGTETLTYDNLNRLTHSTKQGAISYFDNGNIRQKAGVAGESTADYTYDAAKPHTVATAFGYTMGYDANGNLASRTGNGQTWAFRYAGFDKPRWMARDLSGNDFTNGATGSEFLYNADRSRTLHLEFDQMSGGAPSHYVRKRVYGLGPLLEADYDNTAASGAPAWALRKVRLYIPGPDGPIGAREFAITSGSAGTEKALVYHHDHLGSIESITPFGSTSGFASDMTGKSGRYSEDAWGQRRDPLDWLGAPAGATDDGGPDSLTPRGFTGHEMLDELGLVHMNGRIYDPLLGRMLSADVIVQKPGLLQSYNRYSYVANNPLSFTDPSGFSVANPEDNEALRRSRAHQAAGNGWRAMGWGLLAVPKLAVESTAHVFRHALPAGIAGAKNDLAQRNAQGQLNAGQVLLGRAALTVAETANAPQMIVANADRIPGVVAHFPGKVAADVKNAVANPSASNLYNLGEDAAAIYGGTKLLQVGVKGLASGVKNAGAADEMATAGAATADAGASGVATPRGLAVQANTPEALAARGQVADGATLYRMGTMEKSMATATEAQYWSLENPMSAGYAQRYGIPAENVAAADFIETATLKPGASFVTRPAPGVGANGGGAIEAVVESGGVELKTFSTFKPGSLGRE